LAQEPSNVRLGGAAVPFMFDANRALHVNLTATGLTAKDNFELFFDYASDSLSGSTSSQF
jgi:hypothetical protein